MNQQFISDIYCIGRNYVNHAKELNNEVPDRPLLFTKPRSSLALANGDTLSFPNDKGSIHFELELVLKVSRDVKATDRLEDAVTEMALGVDLTLRDVQADLKKKGHPWLRAKGFRNATILTEFFPFPGEKKLADVPFVLKRNGTVAQQGYAKDMIFSCSQLLRELQAVVGLHAGDLLFTGTPEGVGPLHHNDVFELYFAGEKKGSFVVRMQ